MGFFDKPERDFKWLTCVISTTCKMCAGPIRQGEGFYFEANKKEPHCRDCGREIKKKGYDEAGKDRNPFAKLFKDLTGKDFP